MSPTRHIPRETPKMKSRDKAKEIENVLYDLPEKVERLLESFAMVDKRLKDVEEDIQQYKSEQKKGKKGEYNE